MAYLRIGKPELAELFGVSKHTITRWVNKKLLNPRDINDVIDKYNNRWKLDKRRKSLK